MVIFYCFPDSVLLDLVSGRGWQVAGETVHIRKQEELIKPKKILAKIDMESEWGGGRGGEEGGREGGEEVH